MKRIFLLLQLLLFGLPGFAQAPTANFTAAQTAGCAPVVISFQDLSTGNPTGWQWDFGNGSTSTLRSPSTTYFTPGTYTVTLTASNTDGSNTLTRTAYVTIYGRPTVNFTADDSTGCAPFAVRFQDLSTAAPGTTNTSWQWDFGNGTSASQQNPQTSFTTPGNYTVSVKVTSDKGCFATAAKPAYVQITGGLQLAFSNTQPARCRPPFPVSFTNGSTGPGTLTYFWSFGDGATSTQQNPTHTYTATGNYTVSLAVTSNIGCTDTLRRTAAVNLPAITTAFTAPDSICVQVPATFNNTSAPAGGSSFWQFGDGSTSNATSPQKVFSTPGTYTVRLIQSFATCADSFARTIRVLPRPAAAFSGTNTFSCKPPLTVSFSNSTTGAVSYRWDFGDGNSSTAASPTHTYTGYGNFRVVLIATNASGCSDTVVQNNFVRIQNPVISFPAFPQRGCIAYSTSFSANINTPDAVTSYNWNLGDGTTANTPTVSHTYLNQGSYTVSLTITTSTGCTETYTLPAAVVVGRVPIVSFTSLPNPVCAFQTIQFTDATTEADTWLWNFGDGNSSTLQNPRHQYIQTGSFPVTLTATNNGCTRSVTTPTIVTVNPPIANFSVAKNCSRPLEYSFTETSTGGLTFEWDFGDGSTSTQANPTHNYAAFGSYTVKLTATNGGCSHTKTLTLDVFDETTTFSANLRKACKAATIQFTSTSTNPANIAAYAWDFSNGGTATASNPSTTYTSAGTFTITLITTDKYGCRDTLSQPGYIRIDGPTAAFTVPVSKGCQGLNASFIDQSASDGVNAIRNWQWFYGDGRSQTFTSPTSPQHLYANVGNYTPRLIVTDAAGCKDSVAYTDLIGTSRPRASFSTADTLNCLGSFVQFSNSSSPQPLTSQWSFGDGRTVVADNPQHLYADTGTYTVQLKITDAFGCSDSITRPNYITIRRTIAAFAASDSLGGCTPFEVQYTNQSQFYQSSLWQLGNGNSTVQNPSQVYTTPGTYNIQLTVTGRGGCTSTATKTIRIFDASATTFAYSPDAGCTPLPLRAQVNTPANLQFTWDFGDGTTLNTTNPDTVYTYQTFGNFLPKLLLVDSGNCLVPLFGNDTVRVIGVIGKFGWDQRFFCDAGTVSFFDSTTFNDPVTSYSWDFGDGATSSVPSPQHSYTAPGLYTVSLALQTQQNCRDTVQLNQLVKVVASPSIRIDGDSVICQNEWTRYAGLFNRPDTSQVRWDWQFPNGNTGSVQLPPVQQFTRPGLFSVQAVATNSSGCTDTVSTELLVNPVPVITIPSPQTTPLATPILLPATYTNNIVSYTWTPVTGLSCTDCPQPLASPKFNTLYAVTAVDDKGCRNTARVQVVVLCKGANLFVPNAFSPNGDGSNDVFYVRGKGLDRVKMLRIFNRWGEVVFEKYNFAVNDPTAGWDGSFRGKRASADVYVYQVEVFCDNSEVLRLDGNLSLLQ